MSFISLDKSKYTSIDINTPDCVLIELADNKSIIIDTTNNRNKLISSIKSKEAQTVDITNLTNDDFSSIAWFLNTDNTIIWNIQSLIDTFEQMWTLWTITKHNKSLLNRLKNFGYSTPEIPVTITPTICYNIVRSMGVTTTSSTTFESMIEIVTTKWTRSFIIKDISLRLHEYSNSKLLSILLDLYDTKKRKSNSSIDYEIVNKICNESMSKKKLAPSYVPSTHEEAVAAAASLFLVDLSYSNNPLIEYRNVVFDRPKSDDTMRELEDINTRVYSLEYNFNPTFPVGVYDVNVLRSALEKDGIKYSKDDDVRKLYNILVEYFMIDSFHYGILHKPNTSETLIYNEDIKTTCNNHTLVSYGSHHNGYIVYTVRELIDSFKVNNSFMDTLNKTPFDTQSILRLKGISLRYHGSKVRLSKEQKIEWKTLYETIVKIQENYTNIDTISYYFIELYNSLDDDEKMYVKCLLYLIKCSALKMRGWNGISDNLPVTSLIEPKDPFEPEIQSIWYITEVIRTANDMNNLGLRVLSLPLLMRSKDMVLYANTDVDRGITIKDRYNIVLERKNNSVHSCILMSSNYLLVSSDYYLTLTGEEQTQNILRMYKA